MASSSLTSASWHGQRAECRAGVHSDAPRSPPCARATLGRNVVDVAALEVVVAISLVG